MVSRRGRKLPILFLPLISASKKRIKSCLMRDILHFFFIKQMEFHPCVWLNHDNPSGFECHHFSTHRQTEIGGFSKLLGPLVDENKVSYTQDACQKEPFGSRGGGEDWANDVFWLKRTLKCFYKLENISNTHQHVGRRARSRWWLISIARFRWYHHRWRNEMRCKTRTAGCTWHRDGFRLS